MVNAIFSTTQLLKEYNTSLYKCVIQYNSINTTSRKINIPQDSRDKVSVLKHETYSKYYTQGGTFFEVMNYVQLMVHDLQGQKNQSMFYSKLFELCS